ncbi:MAG TPA: hypothetical protein VH988_01560 [Thermoanaerobaculia bacterium]|jgi:hypothetical protein|nr:hypothetical protein [Thermoanaerobaculia bacterium]
MSEDRFYDVAVVGMAGQRLWWRTPMCTVVLRTRKQTSVLPFSRM